MEEILKKLLKRMKDDIPYAKACELSNEELEYLYPGVTNKFRYFINNYEIENIQLEDCKTPADFAIYLYNLLEKTIKESESING